jgi:hypothetical protein
VKFIHLLLTRRRTKELYRCMQKLLYLNSYQFNSFTVNSKLVDIFYTIAIQSLETITRVFLLNLSTSCSLENKSTYKRVNQRNKIPNNYTWVRGSSVGKLNLRQCTLNKWKIFKWYRRPSFSEAFSAFCYLWTVNPQITLGYAFERHNKLVLLVNDCFDVGGSGFLNERNPCRKWEWAVPLLLTPKKSI